VTRGQVRPSWRAAALLAAGAIAVHQLRFLVEGMGAAGDGHSMAGHVSPAGLAPWLALLLAAGAGGLLARLARARRGNAVVSGGRARLLPLWAAASAALVGLHLAHELLEGVALRGGPDLPGIFGTGGLSVVLGAIVIGGLVALCLRGARELIRRIAARRSAARPGRAAASRLPLPRSLARTLAAPLARSAAGRAPPAALLAA
jgi:hypothetical protein